MLAARLSEQPDEQLDAWTIEFMRDMSIRRGVLPVLADFADETNAFQRSLLTELREMLGPTQAVARAGDAVLGRSGLHAGPALG